MLISEIDLKSALKYLFLPHFYNNIVVFKKNICRNIIAIDLFAVYGNFLDTTLYMS